MTTNDYEKYRKLWEDTDDEWNRVYSSCDDCDEFEGLCDKHTDEFRADMTEKIILAERERITKLEKELTEARDKLKKIAELAHPRKVM